MTKVKINPTTLFLTAIYQGIPWLAIAVVPVVINLLIWKIGAVPARERMLAAQQTESLAQMKPQLEALIFQKGMTAEQIILVVGEPRRKKILKGKSEQWVYSGARGGVLQWYYQWGKLKFHDGYLVDIEVQHVRTCDL